MSGETVIRNAQKWGNESQEIRKGMRQKGLNQLNGRDQLEWKEQYIYINT